MNRALFPFAAAFLLGAAAVYAAPPPLVLNREVDHLHYYKGTVELDGIAERRLDKETLEIEGDNLCFKVSAKSTNKIPRDHDQRAAWFCFSDRDAAIRTFRLPSKPFAGTCGYSLPATVVIGNYVANRMESEVFDTASLLAVKHRGALHSIPCK